MKTKFIPNVFVKNVGIVKETEKAYLLTFWADGYKITKWIPKSQLYITNVKNTSDFYYTYHNLRTNSYGVISEGTAKKNWYNKKCDTEIVGWFYKKELRGAR